MNNKFTNFPHRKPFRNKIFSVFYFSFPQFYLYCKIYKKESINESKYK